MGLKLYNTLSGKEEELVPGGEKKEDINDYPPVTIYSCGPTVYSYAHIGNFRTFLFNDILRRYLRFSGLKVNQAMNITDVDDKTIKGAGVEGISLKDYTDKYIKIFFEDLASLNIEPAEYYPRATDSIDAMIEIMNNLDKKGIVYKKDDSVYFSIAKFKEYGKLSRLEAREIKSGARYDADEYEKDDLRDFALWKASKPNEPAWETPFGSGRPGWHIECSAMVRKIFGGTIDIHTGGVDLIFPHHENEIAQSEAAYDEKFSRFWVHAEHLLVENTKMSKSRGNYYTLRDLIEKGFKPRAIRYILISAHYRKQLNFTIESLRQAEQALERIDNFLLRLDGIKNSGSPSEAVTALSEKCMSDFSAAMDDDLNTSKSFAVLFDFIHALNQMISGDKVTTADKENIISTLKKIDSVLGFIFFIGAESSEADVEMIEKLINERIDAKKSKNFSRSDEIRQQLLDMGIILEDTKDGTRWKIKK